MITYGAIVLILIGNLFYAYRCIFQTREYIEQYGFGEGSAIMTRLVGTFAAGLSIALLIALFTTIEGAWLLFVYGAIQAIIIKDELFDRYKKNQDFIQKYIFPGGFLPSLQSIKDYTKKTGLTLRGYNSYGIHYSHTLRKWRENFIGSWNNISQQGFDSSFKKIWDFYFSYCEASQ